MKIFNYEAVDYYIGTGREVLSLYKNVTRRGIYPAIFAGYPKVNKDRIYGLAVYHNEDFEWDYGKCAIIGETDVCYILMGEIERLTTPVIIDGDELERQMECMEETLPF